MRERLKKVLSEVSLDDSKRLVIYGTDELTELAYLSITFEAEDPGRQPGGESLRCWEDSECWRRSASATGVSPWVSTRETELTLVAFVDGKADRTFLSHPRVPLEAVSSCEFDVLLIAELEDPDKIRDRLIQAAVPSQKVRTLLPASEILVKTRTASN